MSLPDDMICPTCFNSMAKQHIHGNSAQYRCYCGYVLDINEDDLYNYHLEENL